jgi:hypothetical protein
MKRHCWLVAGCALLALTQALAANEFYVAPTGSDTNPGTLQKPFATVQKARDAVRSLRQSGTLPPGQIAVNLRGGTYYLPASLELTQEDSGSAVSPIVYRAYDKEPVWLNGGAPLRTAQWRPVTDPAVSKRLDPAARGKVVQIDLAAAGIPEDVPELPDAFRGFTNKHPVLMEIFCNGRRMQLARWPNEGFAHFGDIVDPGKGLRDPNGPQRLARFKFEDERLRRWNVDEGIWMLGYWARAYVCDAVRAGKIDQENHEIQWAVPLGYGLDNWGAHRFYVFNMLSELDVPGEYFLDRKTHTLYFWPPKPLAQCNITVSRLATPMISAQKADYLTFRNLGFENGRQNALSFNGCSHCRVIGCTIRDIGMDAVMVTGGVDDGVVGCDIHDTGYGGIRLSGGDRKTLTPCNHFADNNHIYRTSIIRRTHAGPISLNGVGLRAAHNLLHHEPHTAIWYGGNDIIMEYNEIYTVLTDTTEGGVFYAGYDWTMRGNIIRYNYIHHINDVMEGCGSEAVVVHEDDCVSGTTFFGNLCYLTGNGCVMCGGPDNIADNNIFVQCKTGVEIEGRGLDWWTWTKHPDGTVTVVDTRNGATDNNLLGSLRRVPYKDPPWTKYPHLADILDRDPAGAPYFCQATRNIAVGGKAVWVQGNVRPEWVTVKDNWDNEGDPGFVDAAHGDFRLKPGAPVIAKIGFEPLPLDKIGLVNDGTRASWPVKPEPPPAGFKPHWLLEKEAQLKAPGALPVVKVPRASGKIAVDGVVNPGEWDQSQPQAAGMPGIAIDPAPLPWNVDGKAAPWPSKAYLEVDDQNLYIAFINEVDPAKGVSGGQQWGKDDAVEIAIAPVVSGKVGDIIALRGYTNGSFTSSDEPGTPAPIVRRSLQGTQYACKVVRPGQWTAEWKIPFAALGIDPHKSNPRLLFNLSVRKPNGDLWVMWKRTGGFTWQVRNGGVLWLEPFGDIPMSGAAPSQPNVHVITITPGLTLKAVANCEVAGWAKPVGSRLTAAGQNLPADKWTSWEFTFVADRDGQVTLNLMGRGFISVVTGSLAPVWTYYDDLTCDGASLTNGGFEDLDPKGWPVGWNHSDSLLVTDAKFAASGQRCAKCWHDGRFTQALTVHKDQPVHLRFKVRGESANR